MISILPIYRGKPSPDDVFTSLFSAKQAYASSKSVHSTLGRLGDTQESPKNELSLSLSPFVDFLSSAEPSPLLNILTVFITLHNAEAVVDFGRPAPPLFQLIPIDSRGCWSPFTCIGICMKIRRLHATPYTLRMQLNRWNTCIYTRLVIHICVCVCVRVFERNFHMNPYVTNVRASWIRRTILI